jgi:hypothetical protein
VKALRGFIPDYNAQTVTNESSGRGDRGRGDDRRARLRASGADAGSRSSNWLVSGCQRSVVGNTFGGRIALKTARGMEIACPGYGHAAPRPSS